MLFSTHIDQTISLFSRFSASPWPFHYTGGIKKAYKPSARDTTSHPSSMPHSICHQEYL